MHVAQTLKKEVILCPYVRDIDIQSGHLDRDVCIANIKTPVNSRDAICGQESDMISIHAAILAESDKGFEKINASVEGIRLNKVLNYDLEKIEGESFADVFSIIHTDDEESDDKESDDKESDDKLWDDKLWDDEESDDEEFYDKECVKKIKKALILLASSITIMVDRVHSLNDEVPDFEEFLQSKPESAEPKDVFREWKEIVENLIREKH